MAFYIGTCMLSAMLMVASTKIKFVKFKGVFGKYGFKWIGILLAALPMLLVAGLRYDIGTDYYSYGDYYRVIGEGNRTNIDFLYYLINVLFNKLNLQYEHLVFALSAFFVIACFVICRNESPYPAFSVLLFFGMDYYFAEFNITRQMIAIAVLMFSIKYCYERKFIPFAILVAIATGLHASCAVFLVVYFIPEIRITTLKIAILSVIIIAASPFVNPLLRLVSTYTKYGKHLGSIVDNGSTGFINIAMQFLILLFVSMYRDKSRKYHVYFNCQFINACLGLMSSIPLIRRVQYIFGMPAIILVAMAISKSKSKTNRTVFLIVFTLLFMVYCTIITNAGYQGVLPYTSILGR